MATLVARRLPSSAVLVGDREREGASGALRRHFVQGRLSTAELGDRIELALRARSRDDLDAAMQGLPPAWWDVPSGVHEAARRFRDGVRRARTFLVLVRLWFKANLVLVLAAGLALVAGAPAAATFGAAAAAWALATFAFWRLWCRRRSRL